MNDSILPERNELTELNQTSVIPKENSKEDIEGIKNSILPERIKLPDYDQSSIVVVKGSIKEKEQVALPKKNNKEKAGVIKDFNLPERIIKLADCGQNPVFSAKSSKEKAEPAFRKKTSKEKTEAIKNFILPERAKSPNVDQKATSSDKNIQEIAELASFLKNSPKYKIRGAKDFILPEKPKIINIDQNTIFSLKNNKNEPAKLFKQIQKNKNEEEKELLDDMHQLKSEVSEHDKNILRLENTKKSMNIKLNDTQRVLQSLENELECLISRIERNKIYNEDTKAEIPREYISNKVNEKCNSVLEKYIKPMNTFEYIIEIEFNKSIIPLALSESTIKNFGQIKPLASNLFGLDPNDIVITDEYGNIFLNNTPILDEIFLAPGYTFQKIHPRLKLLLTNNQTLEEMMHSKIYEHKRNCDSTILDLKQSKDADAQKYQYEKLEKNIHKEREEVHKFQRQRAYSRKIQRIFIMITFLILIILWLFQLFYINKAKISYLTTQNILRIFEDILDPTTSNPLRLYLDILGKIPSFENNTDTFLNDKQYPWFFLKNDITSKGLLIQKVYDQKKCAFLPQFARNFYEKIDLECLELVENQSSNIAKGQFYQKDMRSISLDTIAGEFDTSGFRYTLDFANKTLIENIISELSANFSQYPQTYGWIDYNHALLHALQINFYNPSYEVLSCFYEIIYHYNYDVFFRSQQNYVVFFREDEYMLLVFDFLMITISGILIILLCFESIEIILKKNKKYDLDLNLLKNDEFKTQNSSKKRKTYMRFNISVFIVKVGLPSRTTVINIISVILMFYSTSTRINYQGLISSTPKDASQLFQCHQYIQIIKTQQILSAIQIHLLLASFLKYMSKLLFSFHLFCYLMAKFLKSAISLGILVIWVLLTLTIFGIYIFGHSMEDLHKPYYMFISLIFATLGTQIYVENQYDEHQFENAKAVAGDEYIYLFLGFAYFIISYILLNIFISIIITTINRAKEKLKRKEKRKKYTLSRLLSRFRG